MKRYYAKRYELIRHCLEECLGSGDPVLEEEVRMFLVGLESVVDTCGDHPANPGAFMHSYTRKFQTLLRGKGATPDVPHRDE